MSTPLYYYRNRSGLVAVSYDEGNNIIIPTGRVIEIIDAWEEDPGDCHKELNHDQVRILDEMILKQRDDEMNGIINKFSRMRRDVGRREGTWDDNSYKIRDLPDNAKVVVAEFD